MANRAHSKFQLRLANRPDTINATGNYRFKIKRQNHEFTSISKYILSPRTGS